MYKYKDNVNLSPSQIRLLDNLIGDKMDLINKKLNNAPLNLNLKSQFKLIKDIESILLQKK